MWRLRRFSGLLFVVLLISGCREPTPPSVTAVPRAALSSIVEPLPTAQPIPSIADLSPIPDDDPSMVSHPQGKVVDGIAYITRNRDLWLIDVQNRERPFVLTHITLPAKTSDLAVADNRLFLALHAPYSMLGDRIRSSGVVQFDITNPTNLVEVGFFHAPEMTGGLSVVGNELYVYEHHHRDPLGRQSGFHHVNSANMAPLSFISAPFYNDNWQFIRNQDWLYTLATRYQKEITWNNIHIHVYNAAAEEVNEVLVENKYSQRSFFSFSTLLLEGEILYLLGAGLNESGVLETGLIVFDVSQPMEPVQVNDVSFKDWQDVGGQHLAVEGNILVVAAIDTLWLLDIRQREEPKLTAVYQTDNTSYIADMGFDNDQLYLVREDGLQLYQLDGFQLTESVFVPLPSE